MSFIKLRFEKDKEERPIKTIRLAKREGKEVKPKIGKPVKREEKSFVLDWETELGYSNNPFKDGILEPVGNYIAGYEKERNKLNLFIINNEKFGIITGGDGVGKTILLKWLYEQLKQYKDKIMVYYFTGKVLSQEFILLKSMVNPLLSVYEKKVKKLNKDVNIDVNLSILKRKIGNKKLILLIDDTVTIPRQVLLLVTKIYSIMPLQIIIGCSNQVAQPFRQIDWLKDRLKIQLKGIGIPEATAMIRKRIKGVGGEDIYPFDDNYIKKICKQASYNPKQILALCQNYAIELAVKQVKKKTTKETKVIKEEVKEKEEEVGEEEKSVVPVLKEVPRTKEYKIRVVSQGSEAISLDDLKKKEKQSKYNIKTVKGK